MAVGLDPVAQQRDFSAGMFRGVREDLIPPNGVYDATNGLLDSTGLIYKRGGSSYRNASAFGTSVQFVWDGYLTGGNQRTVIGTPSGWATIDAARRVMFSSSSRAGVTTA